MAPAKAKHDRQTDRWRDRHYVIHMHDVVLCSTSATKTRFPLILFQGYQLPKARVHYPINPYEIYGHTSMKKRFFSLANLNTSLACSRLKLIGFSQRTCFPAFSICLVSTKCEVCIVPMYTMSVKIKWSQYSNVNLVIFAGGKFCENVGKMFHVEVIFTILLPFPS